MSLKQIIKTLTGLFTRKGGSKAPAPSAKAGGKAVPASAKSAGTNRAAVKQAREAARRTRRAGR